MGTMLYRTVEENLRVAMRCYTRVSAAGEARDYPGITVSSSGIDCAVFNAAMLTEPAADGEFERRLALAETHYGQRRLGWTFWLCDDLLCQPLRRRSMSIFRHNGMCVIAQPPGMFAERLAPPVRTAPLEVRPVVDDATRLQFASLSSRIFSLPFDTARTVYGAEQLWESPMHGWIGYYEGQPVSIATVVLGGGAAGVYSVGTLPAFQRRGFAETVMRIALEEARKATGIETTVLQTTSQGMNLYLRMGYRVVTQFAVYLQESRGSF